MDHQFWSRRFGRWGIYLHRYQRGYSNVFQIRRHRSAENRMPYGPMLVVHLFWHRWQISIDRHRRPMRPPWYREL